MPGHEQGLHRQPARQSWLCPWELKLMAGRSTEAKKQMSDGIAEVLHRVVPHPAGVMVQLSVDIADMDKATYFKGRL
ncbi:hypothetical protein J4711_14060 [Staphylococcus epidermidis]|nr:hypothetical protein [Staphylococcus epidermidis]